MIEGLDPNVWAGLSMLPPEALVELIDLYAESSLSMLARLRTATEAGDGTAIQELVHSLKGSSAALGVQALQQVCDELLQQGRSGTSTDLVAAVQRIEVAHGAGARALAQQRAALLLRRP